MQLMPGLPKLNILVVYEFPGDNPDYRVRVIMLDESEAYGVPVSRTFTIKAAGANYRDNPYEVFGPVVERFTGRDRSETNISIAMCHTGKLDP